MKIYGPYTRKDGRKHIVKYKNGKRTTQSYPRYLMEQHLGRPLLDTEEVDHTDEDYTNDDINNLQLLTKIENVDNIQERKIFDVSKETEMTISMFESMAYERNVKLSSKIQENIMVNGNKEDIEHILSTLIDNAIKHTESGNEVIVELSKEKNELIIQVKNEGKEIPEKEREKIFERFYRIDKSRAREKGGYGLGLSIAKSIVNRYKGKIKAEVVTGKP